MLTESDRKRVDGYVYNFTKMWASSQALGYTSNAMAIQVYDSQEDLEKCRPGDEGKPFADHNDLMAEIVKSLTANGVPTEFVVFHFAEFDRWLAGKPITQSARSGFTAHLSAQKKRNAS